jgi:DNA-binding response OmpR family regulator
MAHELRGNGSIQTNQTSGASRLPTNTVVRTLLSEGSNPMPEFPARRGAGSPVEPLGTRILVVDDEIAIRELLEYGLAQVGFTVRAVADGHEALEAVASWAPDLIVLDVVLPEIDGFALLPVFRRMTDVPIIMLTARSQTSDKVSGLARGADDYIAKPFEMDELIARVESALRRPRLEVREILRYLDLMVDVGRRAVTRDGRRIELSNREFDLLVTLINRPEQVFTRSQLLDLVWGIDRDVTPATVETYISYLRAKIDADHPVKLIQTLRGAGYTLKRTDVTPASRR